MSDSKIALYIHWPFCLSKCPYCDFNSHVSQSIEFDLWRDAYMAEIEYYRSLIEGRTVGSIFFGGGTPSLMHPSIVEAIISKISEYAIVDDDTEITLEANPTSVEAKKFIDFKNAGINRVSIGVQSFDDNALIALGRHHRHKETINAIELAHKYFDRFSFDLIYARPEQSLEDWQKELDLALHLAKDHISLYQLTIEKGTSFYKLHKTGELVLPDNEIAAEMYEYTSSALVNKGFAQYEISNYAKPNKECKHNLSYWNYDEYLGIGPGAHSRIFRENTVKAMMDWSKPEKWLNAISEKGFALQSSEQLSQLEIIDELIMMGLRLNSGINDDRLKQLTGLKFDDVINLSVLDMYKKNNLVSYDEAASRLKLTNTGLLMHSYIVPRLIRDHITIQ